MTDHRTQNRPAPAPSLTEAIDRLADELDDVHRHKSGTVVEYVRGTTVFAVRQGAIASFRLRPEIAEAALRTADTVRSSRGAGWITLQWRVVDGFTLDRALAWFESAWRLAGEAPDGRPAPPRPN
ncbi:MAG: hypothetical protein ABSD62_02220 [Candidatus Limnocylindrales bacterium]